MSKKKRSFEELREYISSKNNSLGEKFKPNYINETIINNYEANIQKIKNLTEDIKNLPPLKHQNISSADVVMLKEEIKKVDDRVEKVEQVADELFEYFENKTEIIIDNVKSYYGDALSRIEDMSSKVGDSIAGIYNYLYLNVAANKFIDYFSSPNDEPSVYANAYDYVDGVVKKIRVHKEKFTIEDSQECYFNRLYYNEDLESCTQQLKKGHVFVGASYAVQLKKNFPIIEAASDLEKPALIGVLKEHYHEGSLDIQ
jgi:hypothetical protein